MPTFHRRCQSWVGSYLHSIIKSCSNRFGGSSMVNALASTVSPKRRLGDLSFLSGFQLWEWVVRLFDLWYGKLVASFSGVVCRVCSVPTVLCFMGFPTCVTFCFWQCNRVDGSNLRFNVVVSVCSQLATPRFIEAIFAPEKAISSLVWFFLGFRRGNVN